MQCSDSVRHYSPVHTVSTVKGNWIISGDEGGEEGRRMCVCVCVECVCVCVVCVCVCMRVCVSVCVCMCV